jgi:hypothetical protein
VATLWLVPTLYLAVFTLQYICHFFTDKYVRAKGTYSYHIADAQYFIIRNVQSHGVPFFVFAETGMILILAYKGFVDQVQQFFVVNVFCTTCSFHM